MSNFYTAIARIMSTCFLTCSIFYAAVAQPVITSVTPSSANPGTNVTINGSGFNTTAANNVVFFGGVKATASTVDASGTTLTVTVPYGAQHTYVAVLDSANQQIGIGTKYFVPSYNSSCYIPGTSRLKSRLDISVPGTAGATEPRHAAIGDVDGDGKPDMVVSSYGNSAGQSAVEVYLNNSTVDGQLSFNTTPYVCSAANGAVNVKLGDLDGDGRLDIVVACGGSGRISLLRNTSTGTGMAGVSFAVKRDLAPGIRGIQETALADFDGDGKLDIAAISSDDTVVKQLIVFRNSMTSIPAGIFPATAFGTSSTDYSSFLVSGNPIFLASSLSAADFDNDGHMDIVVGVTLENAVSVVRNNSTIGNISFEPRIVLPTGGGAISAPTEVITTDINSDGRSEIVIANYAGHMMAVFENVYTSGTLSTSSFSRALVNLPDSAAVYALAAGDFNGDAKPDIALSVNSRDADGPNNLTILQNNYTSGSITSSAFTTVGVYNLGAGADNQGISVGDIDLDGKADAVVASFAYNRVSVFENTATPDTTGFSLSADSVCMYTGITASISGTPCSGETFYWSSATGRTSAPASASATPTITGVSAGIDTIISKVVYLSDTNYVRRLVEVKAAADTGTITGSSVICQNYDYLYSNTATGGTWSVTPASVATINSVGLVTALTAGTFNISYTNSSLSCGNMSAVRTVTVNTTPNAGTITGANGTCTGTSLSLTASAAGGTWANLNPAIGTLSATSGASVTVTANAIGADTIIYYVTNGSGCTDTVFKELGFVAPSGSSPSLPIVGTTNICPFTPTTLTNGLAGGTW